MLSSIIQGTVQCHKENVKILRTSNITGDMSTTASSVYVGKESENLFEHLSSEFEHVFCQK